MRSVGSCMCESCLHFTLSLLLLKWILSPVLLSHQCCMFEGDGHSTFSVSCYLSPDLCLNTPLTSVSRNGILVSEKQNVVERESMLRQKLDMNETERCCNQQAIPWSHCTIFLKWHKTVHFWKNTSFWRFHQNWDFDILFSIYNVRVTHKFAKYEHLQLYHCELQFYIYICTCNSILGGSKPTTCANSQ